MGIRMVMGLAKDTRYFNAFGSNNLILWLDAEREEAYVVPVKDASE